MVWCAKRLHELTQNTSQEEYLTIPTMNSNIYFHWLVLFPCQNTHQLGGRRLNVHHCHERFPSDIFRSSAKCVFFHTCFVADCNVTANILQKKKAIDPHAIVRSNWALTILCTEVSRALLCPIGNSFKKRDSSILNK